MSLLKVAVAVWLMSAVLGLPALIDLFRENPLDNYPRLTRWAIYGFSLLIFFAFAPFVVFDHFFKKVMSNG